MPQTIRSELHSTLANIVISDIQLLKATYHYYLGKVEAWEPTDTPASLMPILSQEQDDLIRENMVYLKKVTANDVSLIAARHDWTTGTMYDRWDSSSDMVGKVFFITTSEFKVYKCLDNNGGAASTVEPTTTEYTVTATADGYLWKYMYTIPTFKWDKFATTTHIPVQRAVTDSFYNRGSITEVIVMNGGSGYSANQLTIVGDGTGATCHAIYTEGMITSVIVDTPGTGYTYGTITIGAGGGSGAVLAVSLGIGDYTSDQSIVEQTAIPGALYAARVTTAGTNYSSATTVSISGDGTGATAIAIVAGGEVTAVKMVTYGSGYTYATVTISDATRLSGIEAAASAIHGPTRGHGFDAVTEMRADTLAIGTLVRSDTLLELINQEYRQYGLVRNVNDLVSGMFSRVDSDLLCYVVLLNNTTNLVKDEILTQLNGANSYSYRVASFSGNTVYLQMISKKNLAPNTTSPLVSVVGSRSYVVQSIASSPVVDKYSGSLLLLSNEPPFLFTSEQGVAIKTYLRL